MLSALIRLITQTPALLWCALRRVLAFEAALLTDWLAAGLCSHLLPRLRPALQQSLLHEGAGAADLGRSESMLAIRCMPLCSVQSKAEG